MTAREIAEEIRRLSARELAELKRLLEEDGWDGGLGVREPRRRPPDSPGDRIALDARGLDLDSERGKTSP